MIGKYINQFMADNELLVNEEFFILLNWIATNLNNGYWLKRHFLKKETEKC